jgi:kynurenine 3-monooxygenase
MRLSSTKATAQQRSINLAISSRGIAALQTINPKAADQFVQSSIPMKGRMIHGDGGELKSFLYDDLDGQVSCRPLVTMAVLTTVLKKVHLFNQPGNVE